MSLRHLRRLWLKALLFSLFGYATLGKGFACFFVGEVVLAAGVLIFLRSPRVMLVWTDPTLLLWAAFSLWGLCRTLPFLSQYGIDAVRDAVLWGYGTAALLTAAFFRTSDQISRALNAYRKFLRWYLPVVPFLVVASNGFNQSLPAIPWRRDVTFLDLKSADAGVHLAAAVVFLLLFPDRTFGNEKQGMSVYRLMGFAGIALTVGYLLLASRGGLVAMMFPILLASTVKVKRFGWKVGVVALAGILAVAIIAALNPFSVHFRSTTYTAAEIGQVATSTLAGRDDAPGHEGSTEWRLTWWRNIVHYTIFGPYRWTGQGFGVNLALEGGPGVVDPGGVLLRSPHNGNMTVLARMGVPGIVIWALINGTFVSRLFHAYLRAIRSGSLFWSRLNLWIFCYWLAAFIDLSLDVYLEGPPGGILFWSIIGFGVAVIRVQGHETRQSQAKARALKSSGLEYSLVPV